jgi:hypothetical protein
LLCRAEAKTKRGRHGPPLQLTKIGHVHRVPLPA